MCLIFPDFVHKIKSNFKPNVIVLQKQSNLCHKFCLLFSSLRYNPLRWNTALYCNNTFDFTSLWKS
jgi:hypothetical protein